MMLKPCQRPRRPLRKRGIVRFEHLLNSTEILLQEYPDSDISLALIARQSDVPLPSIYHFFPNRDAILVALAGRYHAQLDAVARVPLDPPPVTWQDITVRRQRTGAAFLNAHPAALRLFMGAGVGVEVRTLDLEGNTSLANVRTAEFRHWFDCRGVPDLEQLMAISIGIMDGVWAVSWSRHRRITEDYLIESTRACVSYLRCYLPETLAVRSDDRSC